MFIIIIIIFNSISVLLVNSNNTAVTECTHFVFTCANLLHRANRHTDRAPCSKQNYPRSSLYATDDLFLFSPLSLSFTFMSTHIHVSRCNHTDPRGPPYLFHNHRCTWWGRPRTVVMEALVVATEASADDAFRIQSRTPAPTNATRTLCLFEFGSDLIIFERTFRALAFGNSAPVRSPFQGTSHHAGVSGKLIRHNMFLILGYTGLRDNARTHTYTASAQCNADVCIHCRWASWSRQTNNQWRRFGWDTVGAARNCFTINPSECSCFQVYWSFKLVLE